MVVVNFVEWMYDLYSDVGYIVQVFELVFQDLM